MKNISIGLIRDISLGMMMGVLICMIILSFYPITPTELTCGKCGAKAYWFHQATN